MFSGLAKAFQIHQAGCVQPSLDHTTDLYLFSGLGSGWTIPKL